MIVDRLTKVAYFLPVKTTYTGPQLAALYMERIVCLHGVPKKIVSDRGTQVTSHFWQQVHSSLGTKLNFSIAYHPQTDRQTERTNQILEDMLRACVLQYCTSWDKSLSYALFSYNNSYQKRVSIWHLLKLCMNESVEPRCFGIKREKLKCSDRMF